VLVRNEASLPVYLYGQPSGILQKLIKRSACSGELLSHMWARPHSHRSSASWWAPTLGSVTGLCCCGSRRLQRIVLRPVIVAINGVPKIALAPLVIVVWFGVGYRRESGHRRQPDLHRRAHLGLPGHAGSRSRTW
jgi:NitT/TauT family transport system permease protein